MNPITKNMSRLRRYMLVGFGIGSSIVTIDIIKTYHKKQHLYHKELINRLNEVHTSGKPLSGVYLHVRPPFPQLGSLSYLLPYHWSLSIREQSLTNQEDLITSNYDNLRKYRHVGLQRAPNQGFFGRVAIFGSHLDDKYNHVNATEYIIPIECWIEYKQKYGHYPGDEGSISQELLNEFTITLDEIKSNQENTNVREYIFGQYINHDFVTCRSVTLEAIRYASIHKSDA